MNDLAQAYANAGKALLDLADALTASPEPTGAVQLKDVAPWTETDNWEDPDELLTQHDALPAKPSGSAAVCPSHNIEYRKGRYGPYCPSMAEDPKWSNDKGYCRITPKSAAAWLRQHA